MKKVSGGFQPGKERRDGERQAARETEAEIPKQRSGKRPDASPEQLAARAQDAKVGGAHDERKKSTRWLIRMGEMLAAYGFSEPAQVEEI